MQNTQLTKQVPCPPFYKLALGKQPLVFKDELEILRVMNENSRGQCWHTQSGRLIAKLALALFKPAEEVPTGL
jgi:hypothetical protein